MTGWWRRTGAQTTVLLVAAGLVVEWFAHPAEPFSWAWFVGGMLAAFFGSILLLRILPPPRAPGTDRRHPLD